MNKPIPKSFPLRLPEELREILEVRAKENGRSLNNEITTRLDQSIKPEVKTKDTYTLDDVYRLLLLLSKTTGLTDDQINRENVKATFKSATKSREMSYEELGIIGKAIAKNVNKSD